MTLFLNTGPLCKLYAFDVINIGHEWIELLEGTICCLSRCFCCQLLHFQVIICVTWLHRMNAHFPQQSGKPDWNFVCLQYSREHIRLNKLSQNWLTLKQSIRLELELVKRTIAYWRTGPVKVVVSIYIYDLLLVDYTVVPSCVLGNLV